MKRGAFNEKACNFSFSSGSNNNCNIRCDFTNSNYSYNIEFYELSDENYAMNFYNNNKSIFESSKGSDSAETSTSIKNYSKYTLSSNGKYMVVSRIDNTVVYLNVDDSYKDTVKDLLKELGY